MKPRDAADLVLLAALWGASFLFMRVAAPSFGPVVLIEVRVVVAAVFLLPLLAARGGLGTLRRHAGTTAAIGVLNSAIPFTLFAYATLTLTAGFNAILNATVPIWTALVAGLWLREKIRASQWLGLAIGVAGVLALVWDKLEFRRGGAQWDSTLAIGAALLASVLYGIAANLAKRKLDGVPSLVTASGSQLGASLALAPFAALWWPDQSPSLRDWSAAIVLGIACTGIAYILYFRLIDRVGAMRAANVTFLIPLFGTLWGLLFLGEAITARMIVGGAVILAGTALALGVLSRAR